MNSHSAGHIDDAEDAGSSGGGGRRRRRWPIFVLIFVLVMGVGATGLFLRLLSAPIMTAYGTDRVGAEIAAGIGGGATASVGVVGLRIAADFKPEIHLRDVRIERPGTLVASVDTLAITTSWGSMIGRELALSRIIADHVLLETVANDEPVPAIPELIAAVDDGLQRTGLGYLDVDAFTLIRTGTPKGRRTVLDKAAITAERLDDRVEARIAAAGVVGPWSVRASVGPGAGETRRLIDLSAEGFDAADVAGLAGDAAPVATGPVDFSGRIGFSATGGISEGAGELSIGPLEAAGEDARLLLDRSRLAVNWRPKERIVVVEPSPVVVPGGHAIVAGEVVMPPPGETALTFAFRVNGRTDQATEAGGTFAGSYDPAASLLELKEITARGAGAEFAAAMRLSHAGGHIAAALSGVFPAMSVDTLKTIWPPMVSREARNWVTKHVQAGIVRDAAVDITVADSGIEGGAKASVGFRFEDLVFRPIDNGPPIREAFGTGRLEGDRFEIVLERGLVDLEDGRTLAIDAGRFVIPTIVPDPPDGVIDLTLSGSADAAVRLWERLPLSKGVDLPADSSGVSGQASAEVTVRLPLIKDVLASQVSYQGAIRFKDLAFKNPVEGRKIEDGDIAITLADGQAAITGTAKVDGVKAEVDITRPLEGGGGSSAVRLVLGAADRAKLGLDAGNRIAGPITVSMADETDGEGASVQKVSADLTAATVTLPELGFTKPKGKAGKATFVVRKAGGRTRIEDLVVEAGAARIEGSLTLDQDGVVSGDFPRVRFSQSDRLSAKLKRDDGAYALAISGERFDARGLVKSGLKRSGGDEEGGTKTIDLDVEIGSVLGWGEEALTGVNVAARVDGGRVQALSFTAQTSGGGAASATVTPDRSVRRIEVEAGEVGRLLRFLDLYPRVFGGRARVTGQIDRRGMLTARVDGARWKIVEEPALARLSTAAKDGPTAGYSTADINRLLFDIRFGQGLLSIDDGVIRGDTAGLSIQGDIDFVRDSMRLAGTYLPASALDSLIGKIPLLGQTVFAGGRAGLFGVTFRLSGPIDDPNLSVNPLSVIAPGIFRKLFELQ